MICIVLIVKNKNKFKSNKLIVYSDLNSLYIYIYIYISNNLKIYKLFY